ncbi:MAG: DUF2953 domain-containing protein [Oscillospiraceae bacterium]
MGWIIFGAVALVIFLLMISPAALRFEYGDNIFLRISWLFITIVKIPAEKKKTRRRNKKVKKAAEKAGAAAENIADASAGEASDLADSDRENAAAKPEKADKPAADGDNTVKKNKPSLGDIFEMVKLVLDSLGKPLKKILKRTRIHHLRIYIVCGGEDAAKAAIKFGTVNILVGNALGWIGSFFTLKPVDEININVDFQSEETKAEASCTVKMPLYAALAFAFTLLGRAARYYLKHPDAQRALKNLTKK